MFLKQMTTVILAGAVVIWFLSTYPASLDRGVPNIPSGPAPGETALLDAWEGTPAVELNGTAPLDENRAEEVSYLERIGASIHPVFVPLGFPWEASVALLSGFVAKEIVVSTFGVLYGAADDSIGARMIRGGWTPAAAYSFMVFVLLYTPCLAAIAAIKRETSPTIASFSVAYSLVLAWIVAFAAYRIGVAAGLG
jgi:ferrous iron transport protein B